MCTEGRDTHAIDPEQPTKEVEALQELIRVQSSAVECAEHNASVYEKKYDEANVKNIQLTKVNEELKSTLGLTREQLSTFSKTLFSAQQKAGELEAKQNEPDWFYETEEWNATFPISDPAISDVLNHYERGEVVEISTLINGPKRFYVTQDYGAHVLFKTKEEAIASLNSNSNSEGEL